MNAPSSPTDLESRLTAALNARAGQVAPEDLGPARPPATVSPLRRRVRVGAGLAAVGAVAAASVIAVSVINHDDERTVPGGPATESTSVATDPTTGPTTDTTTGPADKTPQTPQVPVDPAGLLPQDQPMALDGGATADFADGSSAVLDGDRLVVTDGGTEYATTIEGLRAEPYLSVVQVVFGTGNGYLVAQSGGGDSNSQTVYVPEPGGLAAVQPDKGAPFGYAFAEGFGGYQTWTVGDGEHLVTVEQIGTQGSRWKAWEWQLDGTTLLPTPLGTVCLDFQAETAATC
ncbi:hypothetical protein [Nocardioides sp. GXZ039]|uniref:hypothetical protein n=1 Tax=Nocardioides sp. GXZ039 TaxID=3136018 RepID=UPI0030F45994